jgi:hypothetical protein
VSQTGKQTKSKKGQNTVGTQFKTQLDSLMATIAETSVNYIRCIKPNPKFSPVVFDQLSVLNQLRYSGVLEAVRISRASYPNRQAISDFVSRFKCLLPRDSPSTTALYGPDGDSISLEDLKQVWLFVLFMTLIVQIDELFSFWSSLRFKIILIIFYTFVVHTGGLGSAYCGQEVRSHGQTNLPNGKNQGVLWHGEYFIEYFLFLFLFLFSLEFSTITSQSQTAKINKKIKPN